MCPISTATFLLHVNPFLLIKQLCSNLVSVMILIRSFGRTALVDRPLVPYTKYWKMIKPSLALASSSSSSRGPGSIEQSEGYTEEINFSDDAYSIDDDFSSDSTGMRGGQGQGAGTRFL
jgi:hypothetical protein